MLKVKDGISTNASSATKLQTARAINGTNFDGSGAITTANWGTARTLTIGSTGKSVNGSANVSWSLSEIGAAASSHTHNYAGSSSAGGAATSALACTGNSATATKLATARTIALTGSVTGSGTFDGSGNLSIATTTNHTHNYAGSSSAGGAANSATKLATARTINGTSFDGSANITTANWGTARTLTIGNSGKSVNGSANVSWSLNEMGAMPGSTISGTTAATAQWYRIAQTTSTDQANTNGIFIIRAACSGNHSTSVVSAGITYGANPALNQLSHTQYTATGISQVRIVYHTTYSGNRAYLEVYVPTAAARTIDVQLFGSTGWSLVAPSTVGSIPSGYTNTAITLAANRIVANFNGSINGNASTATTLQTARTINGTSFNGSANITTANWGTARTLTIGSTGKSVNGSANVSWTLAEIGAAAASHTHNYAGSASAGGAANSATVLATARTINGTSFNGSANITTANWGTARTLTIGSTGKSVNGSANVSWSLSEIGAAAASHNHGLLHDNMAVTLTDTTTNNGWSMINSSYNGFLLRSIRTQANTPAWIVNNYGAGVAFGGGDTKGVVSVAYNTPSIKFAGGNGTAPVWWIGITGTSGATYNLASLAANTANTLATARTINGTSFNGSANITTANWGTARSIGIVNSDGTGTAVTTSVNGSANVNLKLPATIKAALTGNASTATTLQTARTINGTSFNGSANITTANWGTARTLTVGNTGKSVNGSANVSWSLAEIGALPLAGGSMTGAINSNVSSSTHLDANKGKAIINATAGGTYYNMLAKMNSKNGVWTMGGWDTTFNLFYTTNSVISAGTNATSYRVILLGEDGQSHFPGTVHAPKFKGNLEGTASTATDVYFRERDASTWVGDCWVGAGTGDNATYSTHNFKIKSHWGIGIYDHNENCNMVMDARAGHITVKGNMTAAAFKTSSDRRLKEQITPIDERLEKMFMDLKPVNYYMIKQDDREYAEEERRHNGFIAQEIEEAMTQHGITYKEFAGLHKTNHKEIKTPENELDIPVQILSDIDDEENVEYSLNYNEFTALNTHMIQKCLKLIEEQAKQIEDLQKKVARFDATLL